MAVHAHPDDEASKGAATCAKYAAEGVEVLIVTATGGERGDALNPNFVTPPGYEFETLAGKRAVRAAEMAKSVKALGVKHQWLGFMDSGLPEGDPLPPLPTGAFASTPLTFAAAPLVEAIRRFRPHVITTYDPSGGYPHPDHIYTHAITMEAWNAAADPTRYVVEGGAAPWQPLKLYYNHGFSLQRMRAIHAAMVAKGLESPFGDWIAERALRDQSEREVTTRIEVGKYLAARDAALRAHTSQVDPDGFFFAVPRDIEAEIAPYDEYELAISRVPVSPAVLHENGLQPREYETDLFAGIPPEYLV
ncbi:MAG: mycothiol conjugate amidase Mca [Cellulomonadaceae bacterium]|nr:mycothiol conjugate amidase Mca [Cellulomonadaceae bacterium]